MEHKLLEYRLDEAVARGGDKAASAQHSSLLPNSRRFMSKTTCI